MSTAKDMTHWISPEEYLAREERAEFKSEYFQGEVFAMSGATRAHSSISVRLGAEVLSALAERPCEVYSNDTKIRVRATGLYAYPDLSVSCDAPRFDDPKQMVLLNPQIIFEVLSESTELYDRNTKFDHYATIESLKAYVLISQWEPLLEVFWRDSGPNTPWGYIRARGLEAVAEIPSMNLRLRLGEIYRGVELTPRLDTVDDAREALKG